MPPEVIVHSYIQNTKDKRLLPTNPIVPYERVYAIYITHSWRLFFFHVCLSNRYRAKNNESGQLILSPIDKFICIRGHNANTVRQIGIETTCLAVATTPRPETRSTTDHLTTVTSSISLSTGVSSLKVAAGRVSPLDDDFQFKTKYFLISQELTREWFNYH